jgi:hypothetical protein
MSKKERLKKKAKLRKKAKKNTPEQLKKFRKYITEHKLFRKVHANRIKQFIISEDGAFAKYHCATTDDYLGIYVTYSPTRKDKFVAEMPYLSDTFKHTAYELEHDFKHAFKKYVKHLNKKKKKK